MPLVYFFAIFDMYVHSVSDAAIQGARFAICSFIVGETN